MNSFFNYFFNYFRLVKGTALTFYALLFSISTFAQLPAGFVDVRIQGGYTMPMSLVFSKSGQQMLVWERKGLVWLSNWDGSTYIKQTTALINLTEEVADWSDFGIQSVALDPNFETNGLIYLFYQVDRHHLFNFGTPQYNPATSEYNNATISRITRYKVNKVGNVFTTDYTSRKVLLGETKSTGVPSVFDTHVGGQLVFGADGTLFVTTGDNASYNTYDSGSTTDTYWQQAIAEGIMRASENVGSFRSQMLNSHCGKLLRIDPNTGDGLPSNPYFDAANPRSAQSRVWALGFRNPFRCSFKTGTGSTDPSLGNPGTIIVGDVQYATWEELHIIEKGGLNCGWPLFEGIDPLPSFMNKTTINQEEVGQPTFKSLCTQATSATFDPDPKQRRFKHAPPALDWRHGQNNARYPDFTTGNLQAKTIGSAGALVTGTPFQGDCSIAGSYYTGTTFPVQYQNVYFFADYTKNWIKAAALHDNSDHQIHNIIDFAPEGYGVGIVDIEYCPVDGSLYYINILDGHVRRISFGGNRPPSVVLTANQTTGASPLIVNFSSNGSVDPDGDPITYLWDFGDGTATSTLPNPSHTFTTTDTRGFTVKLTVMDNKGATDTKTIVISVNNSAPSVKITNPVNNATYSVSAPNPYTLNATVTDNDLTGMQYAWQVVVRHNTHEHRETVLTQQSPTVQLAPIGCNGETFYYLIELTVTDRGGLTARDSVKIYPNCNAQSLNIANLTATSQNAAVTLQWTNPSISFEELMVVAKEGSGFGGSPVGISYTANASFIGNGSAFEGGKVVYKGSGTGTTVTNLTNNKRYYFRVFTRKGDFWTGGLETSATPTGTGVFDPTLCYRLIARHSNKDMEIAEHSVANGVNIQQGTWGYSRRQVWRLKPFDATYYRLMNGYSGSVADVKGNFLYSGANIQQNVNNGGDNQKWRFDKNAEGYYTITAKHSGMVIDVKGISTANGANIQQSSKNGGPNQQWQVIAVGCPVGMAAFESAQIYSADGYRDGYKSILTWVSNATNADFFTVEKQNKNGDFETLENVNAKAAATYSDKNYYSYTDNQAVDGENIYRIVLVADNTPPQYSNLISLKFKATMDFSLFPNPTSDYVDVDLTTYENRPVTLTLIDASGHDLQRLSVEKANKTQRIVLDGLTNGLYLVRIQTVGKRDVTRLFHIAK